MEVTEEVLSTITEVSVHLPLQTLKALSSTSSSINRFISYIEDSPQFWKNKLEILLNIELPFTGGTAYWKQLYEDYTKSVSTVRPYIEHLIANLTADGRYEHVYIALASEISFNPTIAINAAIKNYDNKSVDIIIDKVCTRPTPCASYNLRSRHALSAAIKVRNDYAFNRIIEYTQSCNTDPLAYDGLFEEAATYGHVDYMKLINESSPFSGNILNILPSNSQTRVPVLEYFLSLRIACPYKLYSYNIEPSEITIEEIQVMIDSKCVDFMSIRLENIRPEVLLILYNADIITDLNVNLLYAMLSDANILQYAIGLRPIPDTVDVNMWVKLATTRYDNDSLEVISRYVIVGEDLLLDNIGSIQLHPLKFLCWKYNITNTQLENWIMKYQGTFAPHTIHAFKHYGLSFRMIGERIAFHVNVDGIVALFDIGFPIHKFSHDILRATPESVRASMRSTLFNTDVKKDTSIYTIAPIKLTKTTKHYTRGSPALSINHYTSLIVKGKLTTAEVDWYTTRYEWLVNVPASLIENPRMQFGIQEMLHNKTNQILRGVTNNQSDVKNLQQWLLLVTKLRINVNVESSDDRVKVVLDDVVILLTNDSINTKYHGLDMFSSSGDVLTSKDQIRQRRRELLQH